MSQTSQPATLSNAEIADRLSSLAQMLTLQKANPYKVRAYRRAASVIRGLGESVNELVRSDADLRVYAGIGEAISGAIREIVETGTLKTLEKLRSGATAELVELSAYPRLDPRRILRIYKKLGISTITALHSALDDGQIERMFGLRMAQHVRYGLTEIESILLYHAHTLCASIEKFLLNQTGVERVEAAGDYRRRVEIIGRLDFLIQVRNFDAVVESMKRYGGRLPLIESTPVKATYSLPSGPLLCLERAMKTDWGCSLIRTTGSALHLRKLSRVTAAYPLSKPKDRFRAKKCFTSTSGCSLSLLNCVKAWTKSASRVNGRCPPLSHSRIFGGTCIHTLSRAMGPTLLKTWPVLPRTLATNTSVLPTTRRASRLQMDSPSKTCVAKSKLSTSSTIGCLASAYSSPPRWIFWPMAHLISPMTFFASSTTPSARFTRALPWTVKSKRIAFYGLWITGTSPSSGMLPGGCCSSALDMNWILSESSVMPKIEAASLS